MQRGRSLRGERIGCAFPFIDAAGSLGSRGMWYGFGTILRDRNRRVVELSLVVSKRNAVVALLLALIYLNAGGERVGSSNTTGWWEYSRLPILPEICIIEQERERSGPRTGTSQKKNSGMISLG